MCLGIPGRVLRVLEGNAGMLAQVDVLGAQRPINLGMLEDPALSPGDWVLIHMGFALEVIDAAGAERALSGLQIMGSGSIEDSAASDGRTHQREQPNPGDEPVAADTSCA